MTDFDPTTNRVPFYLLTNAEQQAMKAWPHGWDYSSTSGWIDVPEPAWFQTTVYRGKPRPVVTSVWFNVYPANASLSYESRALSDSTPCRDLRIAVLRNDTCNGVTTAHLEGV
jgi:hypothetical protein